MDFNDFTVGTVFDITFRNTTERHLITHIEPTHQSEIRQADGNYVMGDYTPVHTVRFIKTRNDWAKGAKSWCSVESLVRNTTVEIVD